MDGEIPVEEATPPLIELQWLGAVCLLARVSGQAKQQVMLAFRTHGLGSHAVAARTLEEFRVRGWLEVRDGARGDGRERVLYLSPRGKELLRRCLEEEARLNPPSG
ncbi:MAG: hypothetical protein ACKO0U_09995 [Gammaproteobacteria bacterium]